MSTKTQFLNWPALAQAYAMASEADRETMLGYLGPAGVKQLLASLAAHINIPPPPAETICVCLCCASSEWYEGVFGIERCMDCGTPKPVSL